MLHVFAFIGVCVVLLFVAAIIYVIYSELFGKYLERSARMRDEIKALRALVKNLESRVPYSYDPEEKSRQFYGRSTNCS